MCLCVSKNMMKKSHAIQIFRANCFGSTCFFFLSLRTESFVYAVIACISISFGCSGRQPRTSAFDICEKKRENYFDILQIYCSSMCSVLRPLLLLLLMFFLVHPDYFASLSPQVTLTSSSAAIKISHSVANVGDAKLKTTQNKIKMVNGTCSCLLLLCTNLCQPSSRRKI